LSPPPTVLLQRLNEFGGRHGIGRLDAELIYNGFWFAPEREMLQALIDKTQENVEGVVRLKLYKGSACIVGRQSPRSLYSLSHVTFEEDAVYDQRDAEGFIKLNALRLRLAARRGGAVSARDAALRASQS
jgi:argininosuccinate synthase